MKRNKISDIGTLVLSIIIIIVINVIGNYIYTNWDWTEEKRYTLTEATEELLDSIEQPVFIKVFLEGDFPAGFKRLQTSTKELLRDFQGRNGYIEVVFEDPSGGSKETKAKRRKYFEDRTMAPVNFRVKDGDEIRQKQIFPYAIISYNDKERIVNLLEEQIPGQSEEISINRSINLLEYKFSNAIRLLFQKYKSTIAITTGNGETPMEYLSDFRKRLVPHYRIGEIQMDSIIQIPTYVKLLIIANPSDGLSERDKFIVDQYLMHGGSVLWLVESLAVNLDSSRRREYFVPPTIEHNLDDLFFEYGLRVNPDLVLDLQSSRIPLQVGQAGGRPQFDLFPWYYHPVIQPSNENFLTKNLGLINLRYAHSIDTLKTTHPLKKTVLLHTSRNSLRQLTPMRIGFDLVRQQPNPDRFNKENLITGVLYEGKFTSLYENRVSAKMLEGLKQIGQELLVESPSSTKMVVLTDADLIKSQTNPNRQAFAPMGFNPYDRVTYDNANFILTLIDYLVQGKSVLEARNKEVKVRLLDKIRVEEEGLFWKLLNVLLPVTVIVLLGVIVHFIRKRRYAGV